MVLNEFIGMTLEAAKSLAKENGFTIRQKIRDGQPLMVTMDIRTDRINVETQDDIVVSLMGIG